MTGNEEFNLSPGIKFHIVKKIEAHKVVALNETRLLPHEEKYLEFHKVSGLILFERNIESLSQLSDLVGNATEKLDSTGLPPLIMADHEGDTVSVLRRLIGVPPSPMAIAVSGELDLAREVARETGREMRKLGINVILAPVADCALDPSSPITGLRTFGRDPERVAEFVHHTVLGYREAGIIPCVKHFPGHGSTPDDSHEALPIVGKTREELGKEDLVPFLAAIRAGVEMVMVSHVAFPLGEDLKIPASFDRRMIGGLLRDEFGFGGVVITDSLDMAASRDFRQNRFGGLAGGTEQPLLAGADLLLYTQPIPAEMRMESDGGQVMSLKMMEMIIHTLERIIDKDRIERKVKEAAAENKVLQALLSILDGSEKRILDLRRHIKEIPAAREPSEKPSSEKVVRLKDYASTPSIYKTVAEGSLVLTSDPVGFVPVSNDTRCLIMPVTFLSGLSLKPQNLSEFLRVLRRHFPSWEQTELFVDFAPDSDGRIQPVSGRDLKVASLGMRQGESPEVVSGRVGGEEFTIPKRMTLLPVYSSRGLPPEDYLARFEDFLQAYEPPLVIVTGWPLPSELLGAIGCLLTFGVSPQVASATARVLAGKAEPLRALPFEL